jgi:serine/threonine-protein kinase
VGVLDTGEQDGRPFVVMERLSGRTLRDELAAGPMPADRIRDVGLQVLHALEAAHGLGIVHRDVKPGNVLDAGVGTWKVADFGIAKWVHADETLTGTGELLGSPSYLAPERIEGHEAGPQSDLYAAGVLLYEALTGRKPFEGDDPFTLATAIREGRYEPPTAFVPDADPGIAAVIEHAMRRDPADRFESAATMAAALLGEGNEPTEHTTAVVSPPERDIATEAEGTETVQMPRMEQTARLPQMEPEPEEAAAPATAGPRRIRAAVIAAGVILAVMLIAVLALVVFSGPDAPAGGGGGTGLPPSLEDALSRLEESVRP